MPPRAARAGGAAHAAAHLRRDDHVLAAGDVRDACVDREGARGERGADPPEEERAALAAGPARLRAGVHADLQARSLARRAAPTRPTANRPSGSAYHQIGARSGGARPCSEISARSCTSWSSAAAVDAYVASTYQTRPSGLSQTSVHSRHEARKAVRWLKPKRTHGQQHASRHVETCRWHANVGVDQPRAVGTLITRRIRSDCSACCSPPGPRSRCRSSRSAASSKAEISTSSSSLSVMGCVQAGVPCAARDRRSDSGGRSWVLQVCPSGHVTPRARSSFAPPRVTSSQ